MNRDQKAAVIEQVAAQIREADAVFAVDYRGLSVTQAVELRSRLVEAGANLKVVKNTLTERAADQADAEPLKQLLDGPTAFAFVSGDAALAAKVLATFRRENQLPEFKGGLMNGDALSVDQIESIARLPAREVLHGQFVGVLASPLTGLVRGLSSMISGLAIQLAQIQEKGLIGGDAPVEAGADSTPAEGADTGAETGDTAAEEVAAAEPDAAEGAPAEEVPADEAGAGTAGAEPPEGDEPEPSEAPGDPVAEAEAAEEESAAEQSAGEGETENDAPAEGDQPS